MHSLGASLYPEIGKSIRKWFSSFGTIMAKLKSICSQTDSSQPSLVQGPKTQFTGAWLAKSTDVYFTTTVTFIDDTAPHSTDYANRVADSPIRAKQTMVLPVTNWTSMLITHKVKPTVCCTADHSRWNYRYDPWESLQHTLKCVCCIYTLFACRQGFLNSMKQ